MRLSVGGRPVPPGGEGKWSPFRILLVFSIFSFLAGGLVEFNQLIQPTAGGVSPDAPVWARAMQAAMYFIYFGCSVFLIDLVYRTRLYIRQTYAIPGHSWLDLLYAWFFAPCSISQMARHTADYEQHQASCCTETGLNECAPPTLGVDVV